MFKLKPENQISRITFQTMKKIHEAYRKENKSLNDWRDDKGDSFLHIFCRANMGPLSMCINKPNWDAISYAIEHGVDPLATNKAQKTAVKVFVDRGLNIRDDIYAAKPFQKIFFQLIKKHVPQYEYLVDFLTNDTISLSDFDVKDLPKECLEKLQIYLKGRIDQMSINRTKNNELDRINNDVKDELAKFKLDNHDALQSTI